MKHDVIVIGGGPAGSCAALETAGADLDVVVLEKGVTREDRDQPGPDSTDAGGLLDYWLELMDISEEDFEQIPVLNEIHSAEFHSPEASMTFRNTVVDSWYDQLGLTFDRTEYDDRFRTRAEEAGADYRVGLTVADVESSQTENGWQHRVQTRDGSVFESRYIVLADGPGRSVSLPFLSQFVSNPDILSKLKGNHANHVAYQEYRRFPDEVFQPNDLVFWWGYFPGECAYLWFFPNQDNVVRVGLTMPQGKTDLDDVDPDDYELLHENDTRVPSGKELVHRLMEHRFGDEYDIEKDFPLVTSKGKSQGTEGYPISSTEPLESPAFANAVMTGGAMGATSAFHEGGYHLAVATGKIAGELIRENRLDEYNQVWKNRVGKEILSSLLAYELFKNYTPDDWETLFQKDELDFEWAYEHSESITDEDRNRIDELFERGIEAGIQIREDDYVP